MTGSHSIAPFRIVILNGSIAGDMAAAALATRLPTEHYHITVVDCPIDAVQLAFGSAFPSLVTFHRIIGLDETKFLRAVNGTFKLSTKFSGISQQPYHHAFGPTGISHNGHGFHQHFCRNAEALGADTFHDYCLAAVAAEVGKFAHPPEKDGPPYSKFSYGYHFDMREYSRLLQTYVQKAPITHIEGDIANVALNEKNNHITTIVLADGTSIEGDLFIDGTNTALVDQNTTDANAVPRHTCNKLMLARNDNDGSIAPHTDIRAGDAGWFWRIPLRTGDHLGYHFCDHALNEANAAEEFARQFSLNKQDIQSLSIPAKPNGVFWRGNCIALRADHHAIEPYEGMHLHLVQLSLARLLTLMPRNRRDMAIETSEYNRIVREEYDRANDYMTAHYVLATTKETEFWRTQSEKLQSVELQRKIKQFQSRGRLTSYDHDPFQEESWLSLFLGHGLLPARTSPLLVGGGAMQLQSFHDMKTQISKVADAMPSHQSYLSQYLNTAKD